MRLSLCALAPHPPILLHELGGAESDSVNATYKSMQSLAREIRELDPKVVLVISPHGPVYSDALGILAGEKIDGDMGSFNAPGVRQEYLINTELADRIVASCKEQGLAAALVNRDLAKRTRTKFALDHGIMVPLYFLWNEGLRPQLVPMGMPFFPFEELFGIGRAISKAIRSFGDMDDNAVLIASGDLSHRLTPDAPAGYDPRGREFDCWLMENLGRYDVDGILDVDRVLLEKAGECGFRPVLMLLGALDGWQVATEVKSYEGPFGVGYGVAVFRPTGDPAPSKYEQLLEKRREKVAKRRSDESEPVRLARETVELWVKEGIRHSHAIFSQLPQTAGTFVSIKKHGELRGCIGTTGPTEPSTVEEIISNAIKAATEDPRFDAVEPDELDDLVYSVDILGEPEKIDGPDRLDPVKYGVIVRLGHRSGLLLPNLEGVETPEEQIAIAKRKAGIGPNEKPKLQRFEVVRYI